MIITRKKRCDRRERGRTEAVEREASRAMSTPAGAATRALGGLPCKAEECGSQPVPGDVGV